MAYQPYELAIEKPRRGGTARRLLLIGMLLSFALAILSGPVLWVLVTAEFGLTEHYRSADWSMLPPFAIVVGLNFLVWRALVGYFVGDANRRDKIGVAIGVTLGLAVASVIGVAIIVFVIIMAIGW